VTFEKYLVQVKNLSEHTAKVYNKSWNTQDSDTEPKRLKLRTATKHYHQYTQYLLENDINTGTGISSRVARIELSPEMRRRARALITGEDISERAINLDQATCNNRDVDDTSSETESNKDEDIIGSIQKIANLSSFTAGQRLVLIKAIIKNMEKKKW
tara:strand:- start:1940 stop:2410 length:471 start_codon:yes stop_codon:yes gene_type:complete